LILVTGGSGFIGSHVVDKLIDQGFTVEVLDKVKPLRDDVKWFQGDLTDDQDALLACKDVEVVFHLGAVSDVKIALSSPETCLKVNENGTLTLLKAAVAREVERVVLASTTWVYGKANGVVDENTPISMPDHIYTKSKVGQEHIVYSWHKQFGLPYTILRYDIPYGPRMRSNMAIAAFVQKALRREPITVFGNGDQGRCFIFVEDLAEGNVAALKASGKNEVFNLAGDQYVTINQVVDVLKETFEGIEVKHEDVRSNDFKGVVVSIEKAKRLLGWNPKTSFREGLHKYIEHVQKERT